MKPKLSRYWRLLACAILLAGLFSPAIPQAAAQPAAPNIAVDGVIDAAYGAPLASDPLGDAVNGVNLDLGELYVAEDATNFYFAFTINANIGGGNNWGKYAIYVDTTNNGSGGATDAWGRNVVVNDPHKPEFGMYSWVDCGTYNSSCTQFWQWGGSSWSQNGAIDEAARLIGSTSVLEWRMAKTKLGSPSQMWIEVWSTGGTTTDNPQDTINDPADDWNATDWLTQGVLDNSTQYPPYTPVQLDVTFPADGYYTGDPDLTVTGTVSPTVGVEVTVDVNGTALFTPTVDISGAFAQPVTLDHGANVLTIAANDGVNTVQSIRNVQVGADHDGVVFWGQLGHDSRNTIFRTPGGPVTTNTAVTLRLRAASGDLTEAKARVWNDRTNTQMMLSMYRAADDGAYEWWEVTVPASDVPTVYWYRFIAIDGADVDYYEDDLGSNGQRFGGWGQAYEDSPDYSWQLTVYDPAFQTPDWIKNAVVYQIFPDRFRDGDPTNDTPAGTFFYNESGTIVRSNGTDWNTAICDPRTVSTPCSGSYSKNFYGGDLQGLIDKLQYLHDLGITTIYLNPIFESPSNHKYDATDYMQIDDNFGDLATFITLTQQADLLGMNLILDGVFNHVSSDSVYFDRYSRWDAGGNPTTPGTNDSSGACESPDSPYRDWFYFTDVYTGTGKCASSNGTPLSATYTDWAGYDSLPKLQAANPEVRAHIWSDGTNSVGPYWMQWADGWRLDVAGDVDPGTTGDPANNYWEGFRTATHAVNPDTYIVGEEWGNASSWTIGGEWDATMNYQFGSAILSFWRDTTFDDNDHNSGSSAGILIPLSPTELDERLHNLEERYAPEAFYAMMNLLGSHDTSRALFMLDENASQHNTSLYADPNYDWSDAITKLKGVALLQMTMPGAPTIYYGDEVGLVGPPVYVDYGGGNAKWEDDPYNRQPFPWLDGESGTPYYVHLQTQPSQDVLKEYYTLLIGIRNAHPALRTGSFDTLLTDDANNVYAYGRMMADRSDTAIVIINRDAATQTVTLDVTGYLAYGETLENALDGDAPYTVSGTGEIVIEVPGLYGAILTLANAQTPPDAVADLAVTDERDGEIDLDWSAAAGATSYDIYRSLLFGGGYEWVGATSATNFTDSGLNNGIPYYYVIVSNDGATGLSSGYSNEVSGVPHYIITEAFLNNPDEITHTIGLTPTVDIFGSALVPGVTSVSGPTDGLWAQIGFGDQADAPLLWTNWVNADFFADTSGSDQFAGGLVPEETGDFYYVYRYSTTGGRDWVYADLSGIITPTGVITPGVLHVLPSGDTTAPATPLNLQLTDWSAGYVELTWDPIAGDPTLYAYDLYRTTVSSTVGTVIARIAAPTTIYTDDMVTTGETYYYRVQAVDTSFNRSGLSNQVEATPQAKLVADTFTERVPDYTPSGDTVYVVGDLPELSVWSPGALPMTEVSPHVWSRTINIPDGTAAQYKYTRGGWDTVEAWGTITGYANRSMVVAYGADGNQLVDDTATDWGVGPDTHKAVQHWVDPLVVSVYPEADATGVLVTDTIRVTWSHTMTVAATYTVSGPGGDVSGVFAYDADTFTVIFTPDQPLEGSTTYTVLISGVKDATGATLKTPVIWSFTTEAVGYKVYLPVVLR